MLKKKQYKSLLLNLKSEKVYRLKCQKQRLRSACASAQSGQCIFFWWTVETGQTARIRRVSRYFARCIHQKVLFFLTKVKVKDTLSEIHALIYSAFDNKHLVQIWFKQLSKKGDIILSFFLVFFFFLFFLFLNCEQGRRHFEYLIFIRYLLFIRHK